MQWFSQAPSNIALIKYMGKSEESHNLPDNPSLSYTLPKLLSSVMLETQPGTTDYWEPLITPGTSAFDLSQKEQQRYLNHLQRIKSFFEYEGGFIVRSGNNFPHSSGLASSASSFAALTKCAVEALAELTSQPVPSIEKQAQLSRLGSGSSCRSFFAPWVIWEGESVKAIDLPYTDLLHQVVIISRAEKEISSAKAHQLVKSSQLYADRPARARENLRLLVTALEYKDWHSAYKLVWKEFQDMHALFSSCETPFSYMTEATQTLLTQLQKFWETHQDGPLVTMDAGPNVHLLYRDDQRDLAQRFRLEYLIGQYDVI